MSIKEELKEKKYRYKRKHKLKKMTYNYGDVVEKEDRIVCYMMKCFENKYIINLNKRLYLDCDITKPIYYVFDGFNFDYNGVKISSNAANFVFKNCRFAKETNIETVANCMFDNCEFSTGVNSNIITGNLIIKNCKFNCLCMDEISALNELSIIDTNIIVNNGSNILSGGSLLFKNVNVTTSGFLQLSSGIICSDNSKFRCSELIYIKAEELGNMHVNSLVVAYNGKKIGSGELNISETKEPLDFERRKLINMLNLIKDEVERINNNELEKVSSYVMNNLTYKNNSRPISRILKR